jgi:hypothetical protein
VRKYLPQSWQEAGGYVASTAMLAFGVISIVVALLGVSEVRYNLDREGITGTADMTPAAIREAVKESEVSIPDLPNCSVADRSVNTGDEAKCFASYMRVHALEATGGLVYAQMGRYLTANGEQTSDPAKAAKDPKTGRPVENGLRNLWVTETALSSSLNMAFLAERVAIFSLVNGIMMLFAGIGFFIIVRGPLRDWVASRK